MTVHDALIVDLAGLSPATVARLRELIEQVISSETRPHPPATAGWDVRSAAELLGRLRRGDRTVQADVIGAAVAAGGLVTRLAVYDLAGYPEGRSLKGFTRPVNRLMADLRAEGLIGPEAPSPMQPIYDAANSSFQQASGFRLPTELLPVFAAAVEQIEGPS